MRETRCTWYGAAIQRGAGAAGKDPKVNTTAAVFAGLKPAQARFFDENQPILLRGAAVPFV